MAHPHPLSAFENHLGRGALRLLTLVPSKHTAYVLSVQCFRNEDEIRPERGS